jgi:hypothetical protein
MDILPKLNDEEFHDFLDSVQKTLPIDLMQILIFSMTIHQSRVELWMGPILCIEEN